MQKIIDTCGKYLVVALIMIAMFLFYTSVERKPLLAKDNTKFVKAVVIQNDNEDLQAAADLESGDSQEVVLRIKSGSHKGEGGVFLADTFVHICFSLFFKFAAAVSIDFGFKFFNSNVVCLLCNCCSS